VVVCMSKNTPVAKNKYNIWNIALDYKNEPGIQSNLSYSMCKE